MPHGDFSASRFYESSIKILDLEGRIGSNLLLARSESKRVVYVIERQDGGLYTLCKLGHWVDVAMLAQFATVICHQRLRSHEPVSQGNSGPFPLTTPQLHKDNKRRRLAIEEIHSLVKKRARSQSVATVISAEQSQPTIAEGGLTNRKTHVEELSELKTPAPQPTTDPTQPDPVEATLSQPTAEGIFENIRNHYVEALYHSMVSRKPTAWWMGCMLTRLRVHLHTLPKDHSLALELLST
jgi:DNA replication regulator SLD3